MTSISQPPVIPQQPSSTITATPNAGRPAHSPSPSIVGNPLHAAVPASAAAARSYASATKKQPSPPIVSGSTGPTIAVGADPKLQHAQSNSVSSVNGKPLITPAIPAVAGPTIVNSGNAAVNGASASGHGRKTSVTINAQGATGYLPNGGPVGGPSRPPGLHFGSVEGSPAQAHSIPQPTQLTPSLPTAGTSSSTSSNPRITSPATSPSPIPQPPASGGRPPFSLQAQANVPIFGNVSGDASDGGRSSRQGSVAQPPLGPGPQGNHLRRESSQSTHSDISTSSGIPPGQGRGGYPNQGGRGRPFNPNSQFSQHQQMGYAGGPGFRGPPNQNRAPNMAPQFSGHGGAMGPFPNSPHQRNSRSPGLPNSVPGTPQMQQVPMANSPMPAAHYSGYAQNVAPHQAPYGMPQQFDPAYGAHFNPQYGMYPYVGGPPTSPRPPYNQQVPAGQPPFIPNQYGQPQPQSMSRTPSTVSEHRPNSSMGQPHAAMIPPAVGHVPHPSHGRNSPAPATQTNFVRPTRKSAAIVIKSPESGEVLSFDKQKDVSPASASRASPAIVSSTPTPPPSQAAKSDAKIKTEDEKKLAASAMQDAVAKQIEARKLEAEKAQKEKDDAEKAVKEAEDKAQREKEEAEAAKVKEAAAEKAKKEEDARVEREKAEKATREAEEKAKAAEEETKKAEAAKAKAAADEKSAKEEAVQNEGTKERDGVATPSGPASTLSSLPPRSGASTPVSEDSMGPPAKPASLAKRDKPAALNLAPLKTKTVEPPQPSAALQALRSAKFIDRISGVSYPTSVSSPNPALNAAANKGKFKYDKDFLLQFQPVFTEKPSVDWENRLKDIGETSDSSRPTSARTPSLGPRGTSGRPALPSNFTMGTFGQAGGRTLPPGTTSAERFAAASGGGMNQPRQQMSNPLAQFARPGGSFPMSGPTSMSRTPSSTSTSQGGPNSPRQTQGSGRRTHSKRQETRDKPPNKREEEQAAKAMPLTANIDVKPIAITSGGWKPRSVMAQASATGAAGPAPGASGAAHMEPDMVQRKVKSNLNKMTPEKFEKIADQILEIAAQSKDESDGRTLRQVIQLTFEKATDEAHWASMYAKFCKRMLESMSADIKDESIRDKNGNTVTGGNLFRKYLLNRCQEEFERGWKLNLPDKPEGETEEAVMLSEEYYIAAAAKRRGLGLVQFIGELYKLGMLTERIMHECVKKLVDYDGIPDEAEVESLTKLLRTIGMNLDNTEKGKPLMDVYFGRIQNMVETPELPSRLKFMLMDVLDLRRGGWKSKEANKGPQTIQEIREEAARQAAEKEAERARQQNQRHHGGNRMGGRGDARSFSNGGQYGLQPPPDQQRNQVGMDDLRRLGNRSSSRQVSQQGPQSFGPATAMFNSRSNSGRRTLGPSSMSRGGEDSGVSSRTGTPPTTSNRETPSTSANAFSALAGLEPNDAAEGASSTSSPPTTRAEPATTTKVSPKEDEPPAGSSTSTS